MLLKGKIPQGYTERKQTTKNLNWRPIKDITHKNDIQLVILDSKRHQMKPHAVELHKLKTTDVLNQLQLTTTHTESPF